jgi:hypothetical protein
MTKTQTLVTLLEKRACDPRNPYPYLSGFLTSLLKRLETDHPDVAQTLEEEITRIEKLTKNQPSLQTPDL